MSLGGSVFDFRSTLDWATISLGNLPFSSTKAPRLLPSIPSTSVYIASTRKQGVYISRHEKALVVETKLTQRIVDSAGAPESGQSFIRDSEFFFIATATTE